MRRVVVLSGAAVMVVFASPGAFTAEQVFESGGALQAPPHAAAELAAEPGAGPLVLIERVPLAGRAAGGQAVHPLLDQPAGLRPRRRLVQVAIHVNGVVIGGMMPKISRATSASLGEKPLR